LRRHDGLATSELLRKRAARLLDPARDYNGLTLPATGLLELRLGRWDPDHRRRLAAAVIVVATTVVGPITPASIIPISIIVPIVAPVVPIPIRADIEPNDRHTDAGGIRGNQDAAAAIEKFDA
jgi:hypothetical protein